MDSDGVMAQLLSVEDLDVAVVALKAGDLVAFPTETVYGLGADASNGEAVAKIFTAKGRPAGHPLIVHIAGSEGLSRFGRDVSGDAFRLADAFWPGPLTIIVGRGDGVADEVTGGRSTVGLRVPDHPLALALLKGFDGGVAGPSANRFGAVSPTTARHVLDDLGHRIDVVLDGGPARVGVESTIVEATDDGVRLLRPGGISVVEIEAVLGRSVVDGREGESRAPGMLVSHYAPAATVELVDGAWLGAQTFGATQSVGVIAPFDHEHGASWRLPADAAGYAAGLYATLREADRAGVDRLFIVGPDDGPLCDAVLDRLVKASAPRP